MATITFTVETPVPPALLLKALTDFTPNRPNLWRNLSPALYTVHEVGDTWADVTEGSSFAGGVWERTRYDWSTPEVVKITTTESNSFAPGSSWQYHITGNAGGGSRVECTVRRIGKGAKGRFVAVLLGLFGKRILRKNFEYTLSQLTTIQSG